MRIAVKPDKSIFGIGFLVLEEGFMRSMVL
jgi:hypothetical protein